MGTRADMKVLKFNPNSNEEVMLLLDFLNENTTLSWGFNRYVHAKPPINPAVCSNRHLSENTHQSKFDRFELRGHESGNIERYVLDKYHRVNERLVVVVETVGLGVEIVYLMREGEFDDNKDFLIAEVRKGD